MPNWVDNRVSIYGPKERLEQLRNLLTEPHPLRTNSDGVAEVGFTFLNLICPPKKHWGEYKCGNIGLDSEASRSPYNWYDWNINNWGTKWDAVDTDVTLDETVAGRANLHLRFMTAWSPPGPVMVEIHKLCKEMRLGMDWFYLEEQGWGGQVVVDEAGNGTADYWDIPEYDPDTDEWGERVVQTIDIGEWVREVSQEIIDTQKAREAMKAHFDSLKEGKKRKK